MPVIKSAKKQMRKSLARRARNLPLKNKMKSYIKQELDHVHAGNLSEALKFLPEVVSVIDTALKRNLIHKNNAARKKSRLCLAMNKLQKGGAKATIKEEAKK